MSVPKQSIGLTNFSGSISKCPPNPDAIRAIVFSKCDNLSVVNGAATEMQISLTNFYVPVKDAARISFTLPGKVSNSVPYILNKLDLGGVTTDGEVKFIALFPQLPKGTTGNQAYLEWASVRAIEKGTLHQDEPISPSNNTNFSFKQINKLQWSWGGYLNYSNQGKGCLYAATNGGLVKWDGASMKLWNTLNSNSPTDYMNSLEVDPDNNLWISTNSGLLKFNENNQSFKPVFTTENSKLPSNYVNDFKIFSGGMGVAATTEGMSVFELGGATFSSYDIYNSPLLKHNNLKNLAVTEDPVIFTGTTGGVYFFDTATYKWGPRAINYDNLDGWYGEDDVTSIALHGDWLYVGTQNGLVAINYMGITGTDDFSGFESYTWFAADGLYSDNISSLRVANYGGIWELYIGHGDDGGITIMDIETGTFYYQESIGNLSDGPVKDVLPDFLSGLDDRTLYAGNAEDSGICKIHSYPYENDVVPGANDNTNLLLSIPKGVTAGGNYIIDTTTLYSINQPFYFLFSKSMSMGNFEDFFSLNQGITGSGNQISGSWGWSFDGTLGSFVTSMSLDRATGYNLRIAKGSVASDGSILSEGMNTGFYTENIVPEVGWNIMGKMLVLSGSDIKYTDSIYLRNPQTTDINVIALIGK